MSNLIQVSIPIRVLIVEDSPADAELMLGNLAGHGFAPQGERVETEAAYLAGLNAAPDVILADYKLPHFSGQRALELLNERRLDIPFIVVSGAISDVQAANLIKAGASDFLLKDRLARLGPAVEHALDIKRARAEQRRMEETLAEKEEHFRAAFEQAGVGMALRSIDPRNPRWLRVNQKLCGILGYTREELLQLSSVDVTPPEDRQVAIDYNEKLLRGEITTYSREKRYLRKDGQAIWVNITLAPVGGPDGRPTHIISVIQDISERKQAEERLRKVDRARKVMAECNRVMVHAGDETRLLQDMCRTAVESGGYRMAWVGYAEHDEYKSVRPIAQAGFDEGYLEAARISWGDNERGRGPSGRAIRLGRTYVVRNTLTDPNFAPWRENAVARGYRSHIALPLASQGAAFGVLSLYTTEVDAFDTDEVALLEELAGDLAYGITSLRTRVEHARAEESRAQLAAIVENANDAIVSRALDGTITSWNTAAERLFGYTASEAIGRNIFALMIPPDQKQLMKQTRATLAQGGAVTDLETVRLAKDGRRIDVSMTHSPLKDKHGAAVGASLIFRDITERKLQEQKITRLSRIHAVLSGIDSLIVHVRDRRELFNGACRIAVGQGGFRLAWIGMVDEQRHEIRPLVWAGHDDGFLSGLRLSVRADVPEKFGIAGRAVHDKKPVVVNDVADDSRLVYMKNLLQRGFRSIVGLPLLIGGEAIGAFVLYGTQAGVFDEEEMKLLTELAGDISFALDHIARQEKLENLARIRAVSSGINSILIRVRNRQELFQQSCRVAVEDGQFPFAWIGVLDPATLDVTPVAWAGENAEELTRAKSSALDDPPQGKGAVWHAIRERRLVINNDITAHGFGGPRLKEILRLGYRSQITLPLFEGEAVIGVLTMYTGEPGFFDEEEVKLLTELADDVSFALEHIAKEEKIARLSRIEAVMSGVSSLIVRVSDRQALYDGACRIAVEQGKFGMAWIGLLDQQTMEVRTTAHLGIDPDLLTSMKLSACADLKEGQGTTGRALREKKPVFNNDMLFSPRFGPFRGKIAERGYRSIISLPLVVENESIGVVNLFSKDPGIFNEEETKMLAELAGNISFALDHIAKQEKLEKLARIRAVSIEINAAIVRIREREALLKETCRIAAEHGKFELVWIALLDQKMQKVQPIAWAGFAPEIAHAVNWPALGVAGVTLAEVMVTRKIAVRNDVEAEAPVGILRQEALQKGCKSTVCLPLVMDDAVVAAINLFGAGTNFFDKDELALLNEVAVNISFALQSMVQQEKLNYLAYYDALTGLPNRALLDDRMAQVLRTASHENSKAALVLIDLERFRHFNDTLGRSAADELLKLVAQRLQSGIFDRDSLARVQADAFAGLFPDIKDEADIARIIEEKVIASLNQPFTIAGQELRVAAKIGVALFPGDALAPDALYSSAEAALNQVKKSSDRYLFYAPKMNAQVAERLKLENKLRRALERDEFVLFYQPKVDLRTRRVAGLEALMRWNDPDAGLVLPMEFIPLLEETGMIVEAGAWAMQQAVSQYAAWRAAGIEPPPIAVNVSQVQLKRRDFVASIEKAIAGKPGHGLDLEITESMIMEDIEASIAKLKAVRAFGVGISIDDFGTGHSSLRYLTQLPITALKIDRAFIEHLATNPDDAAIVSTVIALGHNLRLKVIAEGVETVEQSKLLELLGCDEFQGYLFSKPVPAEQASALLLKGG